METVIKASVQKFNENIQASENLEEINEHINTLLKLVHRYASKKNNRPNKGLKVFEEYIKTDTRELKVKREVSRRSEKTYKDFIGKYIALREDGYSWQRISDYMLKKYNIKASRESIRKLVINYV
ncbi:hypothetical protein LCX93_04370 [Sulfurimonas sp. SWIR-19]|uniref:hypothetical protein n=1 Tax=Sulfurimonas sp. SWIR-19 TaxID=2878390 RepID=UPI001CF2ABD7|nr:hypothetical protein [Sulfurimonas sp. SWIR-19]UCN01154.1 hypothetical protein LCX93_04370 [Sulfurimonas sp. SWIR-19]